MVNKTVGHSKIEKMNHICGTHLGEKLSIQTAMIHEKQGLHSQFTCIDGKLLRTRALFLSRFAIQRLLPLI